MLGKHSTSMVPTLKPQDIVLVDRQDKDVMNFKGRIMLVLDPFDGSGKIKRVAAENQPKKRDYRITYYSDNASRESPRGLQPDGRLRGRLDQGHRRTRPMGVE